MNKSTDSAPLTRELFSILSSLVEERTGLHYREDDAPLFGDKVRARANDAGFESLLDYYYFLRYDPAGAEELQALFEALYVHETYFFREAGPLVVALDKILAPRIERGERPRIWSAACSSGEEPLTLAMMLDERGLLNRVDLVASDVSPRTIALARAGTYGGRSLRVIPDAALRRWFEPHGERFTVAERLRVAIDWRTVNLLDRVEMSALGLFDLIICRNVLIYFSDETIVTVVEQLATMFRPEGRLAVGASESLLRFGTLLDCEEVGGSFFYRAGSGSRDNGRSRT